MESQQKFRMWIALIVGLVITGIVFWLMPTQVFSPAGLVLPSKHERPQTQSEQVVFYANQPSNAQTLGSVRVMRHYTSKSKQHAEKEIMNYAKKLAANIGANGIVVQLFGHSMPGAGPSAQAVYVFRGKAIYSENSNQNYFMQTNPYNSEGGF